MPSRRPRIALTIGDINGIGPEVILKCLSDPSLYEQVDPLVVGSRKVLAEYARTLGLDHLRIVSADQKHDGGKQVLRVLEVGSSESAVPEPGRITESAGRLAMKAVEKAVDLCLQEKVEGMVTAPISKEAIARAGYNVPGHTEFIAARTGASRYTMMMVSGSLRVGLVTTHLPLAAVPRLITIEAILEQIGTVAASLREDFGVQHPRIAVLGLNPHAGDGGVLGTEEQDTILPAIEAARADGFLVSGPFPADGFFATRDDQRYDAVLAMYHDQGLIPFKVISFNSGVNFTAGLPIVRTSPDHGTAFGIAGKGLAQAASMRHAIDLAVEVARRRKSSHQTTVDSANGGIE